MVMEINETTPFLALNEQADSFVQILDDGPEEGEAPETFLQRAHAALKSTQAEFDKLTPEDVEDEYFEDGD